MLRQTQMLGTQKKAICHLPVLRIRGPAADKQQKLQECCRRTCCGILLIVQLTPSSVLYCAGVTLLYANARPGGSLETLSKDLLRQAKQLADSGPAEDELQRVKKVCSLHRSR